MLPTLLNTFLIFAFCNTHDLSWGTKGLEAGSGHGPSASLTAAGSDGFESDKKQDDARRLATDPADKAYVQLEFSKFRTSMVMFFIFTNGMLVLFAMKFGGGEAEAGYLQILFGLVIVIFGIRFIGSCLYVYTAFRQKISRTKSKERDLLQGRGLDGNGLLPKNQGTGVNIMYNRSYGIPEVGPKMTEITERPGGNSVIKRGGTSFSLQH